MKIKTYSMMLSVCGELQSLYFDSEKIALYHAARFGDAGQFVEISEQIFDMNKKSFLLMANGGWPHSDSRVVRTIRLKENGLYI